MGEGAGLDDECMEFVTAGAFFFFGAGGVVLEYHVFLNNIYY